MKTSEIVEKIVQLIREIDCDDLVDLHNYLWPAELISVNDITEIDD